MMSSSPKGRSEGWLYAQMTLTGAIWGASWMCGRVIGEGGVPPLEAAVGRFLFGSLGLLVVLLVRRQWADVPKAVWWKILAMGFTGIFLYNICFFEGLKRLPAGRASLMAALQPSVIYAYSVLFLGEKLRAIRIAGILLSLSGAVCVLTQGDVGKVMAGGFGSGDLWISGCVFTWAAYTLLGRATMTKVPALAATAYSTWLGTAMLVAAWLGTRSDSMIHTVGNPKVLWAVMFLGLLGTTLAFIWYLDGVEKLGAPRASIFINLVPVFAVIFSAIFLSEKITLWTLLGGALAIVGVRMVTAPVSKQ